MWTFKRTIQEAFDSGGILLFGLGCLLLFRQQYYPNVLGPLSFGMISIGTLGFVRHLIKDLGSRIENSNYQEILLLLEQRQSEIEANRCMLEELRDACSRFMAMREILEAWQGDPSLIEERAAIFAKILQPRDVATSRVSTQETPSDVQIEPSDGDSPRESENRGIGEENVGVVKLDVQQEQTGRNPKSLQEQALQVRSNISASSQCHSTEKPQKEETGEQSLEMTEESKQEASENVDENVPKNDTVKQEDGLLKEKSKTGDEGVDCNAEELKELTNNGVEAGERKRKRSDSDELNEQEERLADIASGGIQAAEAKNEEEFLKEVEQVISDK